MKHTFKRNIAIVCLLASGLTSLSGCTSLKASGAGELEGSPYPCTWKAKRDVCTFSIAGELPENAQWSFYECSAAIDVEQQEESGQFKVKALESGSGTVTVRLRESGLPVDRGVDFNFRFSVDDRNRISVDSAEFTELNAEAFTTETGKMAFWQESTVGGQFIYLTGADWTTVSTQGVVVYGPTVNGDNVRLEVMAGESSSERSLVLQNGDGEGIAFTFGYENSVLSVKETVSMTAEEIEALLLSLTEEEAPKEEIYYGPAHETSKNTPDEEITEELEEAVMRETIEYWDKQLAELREANNDQNGQ